MVDLKLRRRIQSQKKAFYEKDRNVNPYADFNGDKNVIPISERVDHRKPIEWNTIESNVDRLCKQICSSPNHCHPKEYFQWNLFVHVIISTFMFFKLSRFCVESEGIWKEFPEFRHSSSFKRGNRSAAWESRFDNAS